MKNLYKIFILTLLLFTTTSVVLGDNQGKNNLDSNIIENLRESFSVKGSVGVTDVYGSIHELTPINVGKTLGHSAIGLGFYKAPLKNWGNLTLCIDANVNYGSVAQLKTLSRDTDLIYFVGGTLKFFPWRESKNNWRTDCK